MNLVQAKSSEAPVPNLRSHTAWAIAAGLALALGFVSAAAQQAETPLPPTNPGRAAAQKTPAPNANPKKGTPKTNAVAAVNPTDAGPAPPPVPNPARGGEAPAEVGDPKLATALAHCAKLLDGLTIEYVHLSPIRRGICGTRAPIKLSSIGKNPAVIVSPPATVNCTVAATLYKWFEISVQPTAKALGTQVVQIKNAASYMCRNQYGRSDTKLSEHALANALDISAFTFASGQTIKVLGNWPYGKRPARPQLADMPLPNPLRDHTSLPPDENGTPGVKVLNDSPSASQYGHAHEELTKVATNPFFRPLFAAPLVLEEPEEDEAEGPVSAGNLSRNEAQTFLKTIHGDACKTFWTVLGPEANHAHRDHFHLDMRKRRYVKICQ